MKIRRFLIIGCVLAMGCATTQRADRDRGRMPVVRSGDAVEQLRAELEFIFDDPSFSNAYWGVYIKSLENGQILYTRNDHKGFMPASNMKLYSTAVSLAKLGPQFRYETNLYSTDTHLEDGVLNGDLYVLGSGDPSITARFHDGNPLAPLEAWADRLKTLGVKRITGRVIGDDNVMDDQLIPESWYYTYLSDWYAAESSALNLNDNCYTFYVTPGEKEGDPVKVRCVPPAVYGQWIVEATTTAADSKNTIRYRRQADSNLITLSGSIALNSDEVEDDVTVHNPTLFFTTVFRHVLKQKGIEVEGNPVDIDDLDNPAFDVNKMVLVDTYQSPPMSELIRAVNKPSHNLYADQLLKTLGVRFGEEGSFEQGYEVVKTWLEEQGIDSNGFYMVDGSGLGRVDLVQPRQTIGLLEAMYRDPGFPYFFESLPIAGVDGTIRRRMKGTRAEGNVHAKTGYINRVRSLSGYVTTLDGEMLAFCMMANNYTVPTSLANRLQDQVCERLANFKR